MKKFLAAVIAVMMAFTLVLPAMAEGGVRTFNPPEEVLPEEAADLNEALNVPGGALTFVSEGTYPWVVEEDWAKSTNEGIASSESTVSTTVTAVEGDIVQFDFISGGEGSNPTYDWDNLKFKVDGTEVIHWALHNEWETYAQALTAGEHTLSWTYKKDSSVNPTPDAAKLDNVYVGAPVDPNAINVEDLTVPGNRHAQLIWEVLPAEAFDKSVTFAIADAAIAVIDENGVVTGVAAGETTVTVTSVAVPEVSGTATITVTEALPELTLDSVLNVEGGELHFVSEGTYPWVIPETAPLGQEYAKSSNEGVSSSTSTITAAVTANEGEILQFDFQCWGEGTGTTHWDKLQLKIDGTAVIDWGEGPKEWTTYATALTAGEHNIEWTYSKDSSGDREGDHAFLDNVYVGAPVAPTAINVEDLTVFGNRHAQLVWEVLPAAAFDKSVTFAVDNEDIAVVDSAGLVTGIGIGETTVTVTSVANPEVSGTATITVPDMFTDPVLDEALNVEGGELHFLTEDPYAWIVPEGESYAKSTNKGVGSSASTVSTTVTVNEGDILQFDFQSWGEGSDTSDWDNLKLKIDGTEIIHWGVYHEWTTYAAALTAGTHTVEWTYKKDGSVNPDGDYALLDNVYAGAPVMPNEIQVNPIEVPAGRKATVVYTVLPQEAFDKSVTFATADEAIATVNENGVVTGVTEGETEIIVTSVADPEVSGTAVITVTEALPTVWLNGYIGYDPQGTSGIWGQFADYDPSDVENMGTMTDTFAAAFAGGKVYGYTYDGDAGSGDFYIMDPANGYSVSYPGYNPGIGVFGMAYDHAGYNMYALCPSPTDPDNGRALYEVNLAVGSLQYVADLDAGGETIMTLAISTDGTAYGLTYADENFGGGISELYSINLETGVCTLIGSTGLGLAYVQSMTWDHNTNQLFWAQYAHDGSSGLYTVDVTTGAATPLGLIGTGAEVTGLFTVDTLAIPPIEMPECAISFMDSVTGEEIEGGYTVEAGTVLDPEDFPIPPEHAGLEFTGWDYDGHAVYTDTVVTALYYDPNAIGFYFETQEDVDMWTMLDSDGDGHNWQWSLADPTHLYSPPEGEGCMISFSYDNDSYSPLYPDNWLISPEVPGGGSMSFMLCAQDGGYPDEHIGVYASADGGETWGEELGYFTPKAAGPVFTYTVSLADYAGMNIKLAFRHYDSSDAFCVNLDAVEVSGGVTEPEPVLPEEITVEPVAVLVGETADAVYTVLPEEAEDKTVTFAIADETIATVDENGVVTGVAAGETEITVTSVANPEVSGTATVTVTEPAPQEGDVIFDIRNPETEDGLYYALPGETVAVNLTVTGEYAAHGVDIWLDYDPEMLTVDHTEKGPVLTENAAEIGATVILNSDTVPGSIRLGIACPDAPLTQEGIVYTVYFTVGEAVPMDTVIPLTVAVQEFVNMPVGEETTPIPNFVYNSGVVVAAPPTPPAPPVTGFASLAGAGIASILAGAGVVLFRRKRS